MHTPLIVVVDDELEILELLTMVLEDAGYQVGTATNREAGYRLIVERQPALALLDVRMDHPQAGLDLMEQLRATPATAALPILFMSGEVRLLQHERARWQGRGCAVLPKPFTIAALLAQITQLLQPQGPSTGQERAA